jgi:hypothetical protein
MQFRELRRVLQSIVLATLPACGVGNIGDTSDLECWPTTARDFSFQAPADDPPLDLRVESCRLDADACLSLCKMLMQRAGVGVPEVCDVHFEGDMVKASASYTTSNPDQRCHIGEGRRPAGLVTPKHIEANSAIGAWLAEAAWLEAASIPAFIYLARELDSHGAPRGLSRLALAAARDEIRHARTMTAMARRYGGTPPIADVAMPTVRSLEDMAIENAVEGCVRETWGALVAMWQAQRSTDRELRAAFRAISADEARHSALAWAVDSWLSTRLDDAAKKRVIEARHLAVRELFEGVDAEVHTVLGLPFGADARMLATRAERALWIGGAA